MTQECFRPSKSTHLTVIGCECNVSGVHNTLKSESEDQEAAARMSPENRRAWKAQAESQHETEQKSHAKQEER